MTWTIPCDLSRSPDDLDRSDPENRLSLHSGIVAGQIRVSCCVVEWGETEREFSQGFFLWLNYFSKWPKMGFIRFLVVKFRKELKNFFKNRQISLWGSTVVARKCKGCLHVSYFHILCVAKIWLN